MGRPDHVGGIRGVPRSRATPPPHPGPLRVVRWGLTKEEFGKQDNHTMRNCQPPLGMVSQFGKCFQMHLFESRFNLFSQRRQ